MIPGNACRPSPNGAIGARPRPGGTVTKRRYRRDPGGAVEFGQLCDSKGRRLVEAGRAGKLVHEQRTEGRPWHVQVP